MKKDIKVSASILCADFGHLADEVKKCEEAGVDMLHVDVMDGYFVPNISIGQVIVQSVRSVTKLPIETHLMIENPGRYVEEFVRAGADTVSIHAECYGVRREGCREAGQYPKEVDTVDTLAARADIRKIREAGGKAFMAVNPGTPLCFDALLEDLDGVLVMSVNPGFAKQKFIPSVLPKIQKLRDRYDGSIAVDGGVNDVTAPEAVKAGADILATASYFFGSGNPRETVKFLKGLAS